MPKPRRSIEFQVSGRYALFTDPLILLCHKSSFSLTLMQPQQGHSPRRAMSA